MQRVESFITIHKDIHSVKRTSLLSVSIMLIFFLINAFFTTVAAESEPLLVKVGAYANPPKIFMNKNLKVAGFWPDLIEYIAKKENWKIKYIRGTWIGDLNRLKNNEIDVMPDVAFTENRSKLYAFSKTPVLLSWSRVYINKKNTEIKSIIDLKNKKIAALEGSVNLEGPDGFREIALKFNLNCTFLELDSYREVFKAIEENRADAGITNRNFGNKNARKFQVKMTPIIFQPISLQFAFPIDGKKTQILLKRINNRMQKLKKDENSIYYQLLKKYFEAGITEKTVAVLPGWFKTVLQIIGVILVFFILILAISRMQVRKKTYEIRIKNESLRRSTQLLSAHLLNTPVGAIFWDLNNKVVEWNPAAEAIFGYTKEEAIDKRGIELIVPEDQKELVKSILKDLISGKGSTQNINENITRDGRRIICDWYNTALRDVNGRVTGIASLVNDITRQKKTEEALKKSEDRLIRLFQALPLGIGLVKNRVLQWHNETMSRMLGYPSEELHGKNARILYPTYEEYEQAGKAINALKYGKKSIEIETRWVRKDGSVFDCNIRVALLDPEAEDRVVLVLAEDITDRKKTEKEKQKLEAQLSQAQKMEAIGVLAGGIAHDFNNLLTSIIGNADFGLMNLDKNSSVCQNFKEIREAGQRAASLTHQLLAFSRKELILPEIMNLNSVTMNLVETMLRRLIGEDIELVTTYAPDPCNIKADPGQIEQVIMNLSVNARDAMPKGGKLTIETANVELDRGYFQARGKESKPGLYVMLAVTDSGIGMDRETRARIFEPFFTTKEMGRGTGLGLSTVYGIVKQNNGYIWVYSEEGKGTTFKVYLPGVKADIRDLQKGRSIKTSFTGSETILVVEDEETLRNMAERMLIGFGYKVLTARNGKKAMEILESHDNLIHMVLTDVVMPGMSGRELAEKLQSGFPETRILYMSGYTDNTIAHHGVLEKDVEFIQKPFTRESLAGKIREVLDKKKD